MWPVRLLICDDHALFREGLELVLAQLEAGAELASFGDAESALAHVATDSDYDLVLLDLGLPGMNGIEALERLRNAHPELPVVVLSASEQPEDVRAAIDRGAAGFIPKSTRGSVLLGALRLVLAGGVYVPPLMMAAGESATTAATPAPKARRHELTERQVDVLRLLARGLTNREISGVLKIAEGTVKTHVLHLFEALDVTNRTEAAMRMHELGLDERE
jgi:DNA-binding NarL/FixJ family response regulator